MSAPSTFPPIKIQYKPLPGSHAVKWPLVEVELSNKEIFLPQPLLALVDSGASSSILHIDVAEILGYTRENLQFIPGGTSVSGVYKSAFTPTDISIKIYGYAFRLRFNVIDNPQLAFGCILGEDSLFQWARLEFQRFKGFFEIKFRTDLH